MKIPYSAITSASLLTSRASDNLQCLGSSNGQPLPDEVYNEPLRPQIHYTPSNGFMNDPNGLVYSNGTYHFYHQLNPSSIEPGNQHWGHATSSDLIHWTLHAPAISPDSEKGPFIISGSAVVDEMNTSGLFNDTTSPENRLVAIYTGNDEEKSLQYQKIAYSVDGGYTYNKREDPIIDIGNSQFRDPKVFWYAPQSKWIMVVSLASQYEIIIYESIDLLNWTEASRFGNQGILGYQYECPDLFPINIEGTDEQKWVMIISVNPGYSRSGGSGSQYFIGDFDGTKFIAMDNSVREMDFALDDYAGVTYNNAPDGRRLWVGWVSNWLYTGDVPTTPWRSTTTLTQELSLVNVPLSDQKSTLLLRHKPIDISSLVQNTVKQSSSPMASDSVDFPTEGAVDLNMEISTSNAATGAGSSDKSASRIIIESSDGKNSIEVGIQFADHLAYINRRNSGWSNPVFGDVAVTSITIPDDNQKVKLRMIIDHSQIEVFINDGIYYGSMVFFFEDGRVPARIRYQNDEGLNTDYFKLDALKSIWEC